MTPAYVCLEKRLKLRTCDFLNSVNDRHGHGDRSGQHQRKAGWQTGAVDLGQGLEGRQTVTRHYINTEVKVTSHILQRSKHCNSFHKQQDYNVHICFTNIKVKMMLPISKTPKSKLCYSFQQHGGQNDVTHFRNMEVKRYLHSVTSSDRSSNLIKGPMGHP